MTTITPVPSSSSAYRVVIAVLAVLAVVGTIGLLAEVLEAQPLEAGSGRLQVGGDAFDFAATSCFISDDGFTAAGHGYRDGRRHWVSTSNVNLDLVVGTGGPLDRPDDEDLWLIGDEVLGWQSDGTTIQAQALLSDPRDPARDPQLGVLELRCDG